MVDKTTAAGDRPPAPGPGVLARYAGARPPAPDWFVGAVTQQPERSTFAVDGAAIELLTWGTVGKPGLLFLHGDSAHADWWSFIAPFFAAEWRCAAISWSGMGRSGWRAGGYGFSCWAAEAVAALDVAGFGAGGVMVVAHSLGGYPALLASSRTDRIRGIVMLDSAIMPRDMMANVPSPAPRPHRLYATAAEALARFRFMPPTVGDLHFTIDHIARLGMTEADGGWRWCFDPAIWAHSDKTGDLAILPGLARCPIAVMLGEASELIRPDVSDYMRSIFPPGTPFIGIPEAGHHIMVDQPLALVAALRSCLAYWPDSA